MYICIHLVSEEYIPMRNARINLTPFFNLKCLNLDHIKKIYWFIS